MSGGDEHAVAQLAAIAPDPRRPLILCDVDEVALEFVAPFRALLREEDLRLGDGAFRLHGNVFDDGGRAVEDARVSTLIDRLFDEQASRQAPVAGAAEALAEIARIGSVVLLTAMRHGHLEQRARHLHENGMAYPVATAERSKGAAIASLGHRAPVVFIDDLPSNHRDVLSQVPDATCIHFMADATLRALVPPLPEGVRRAATWPGVLGIVRDAIARSPRSGVARAPHESCP